MDMEICRVCLETSEDMGNIFDDIPDKSIYIADMISQCTSFRVSRGDPFSKIICPTCKQDAINAYEIKQLYEKSHRVFCQMKKDFKENQDLLEEEICEISDSEVAIKRQDDFHGQVKNEPIAEDVFKQEEEYLYISNSDVDQCDIQIKSEKTDHQCNEDEVKNPLKKVPRILGHKLQIRPTNEERAYKCSYCQKGFSGKGSLKLHIRTHTGERPYECSHCQKSFALNCTLQKHIRTHTGERPYKCPHCQKSFIHLGPLQAHKRIHTGERPYKCSHCEKSFSQTGHLQDHIRTHTGERPYKCPQCPTSFSHKQSLQRHINAHTGERHYKCSEKFCEKAFTRIDSLLEHIQSHTGKRPYKCSHCEKGFSLKRYLHLHMRTHTK